MAAEAAIHASVHECHVSANTPTLKRVVGARRPCEAWLRHDAGMTLSGGGDEGKAIRGSACVTAPPHLSGHHLSGMTIFLSPVSTTKMASSFAGSVSDALWLTW